MQIERSIAHALCEINERVDLMQFYFMDSPKNRKGKKMGYMSYKRMSNEIVDIKEGCALRNQILDVRINQIHQTQAKFKAALAVTFVLALSSLVITLLIR